MDNRHYAFLMQRYQDRHPTRPMYQEPRQNNSRPQTQERVRYDKDGDVIMGAARTKLTEEEKEHRKKNGLCFYCGEKGHMSRDCQKRKAVNNQAGGQRRPFNPRQRVNEVQVLELEDQDTESLPDEELGKEGIQA